MTLRQWTIRRVKTMTLELSPKGEGASQDPAMSRLESPVVGSHRGLTRLTPGLEVQVG